MFRVTLFANVLPDLSQSSRLGGLGGIPSRYGHSDFDGLNQHGLGSGLASAEVPAQLLVSSWAGRPPDVPHAGVALGWRAGKAILDVEPL